MLINIEYKFRTLQELNNLILKFSDFSLIEIIIIILTIIIIIVLILFIIPSLNVYFNISKKAKEAENKKIALKQIIIQKEIEEEVEKEIEEEEIQKEIKNKKN